ncbi:hypothetical protein NP233_g12389 [Leucocoprinus birnbaumii]|uniref:F-box domain-containing protein n=1 Tax=Leucocoprinus birnbaumii TaxID=56174 RepID=A0AAD5YJH4_9AGAR|nr:hypothetical protein NP233_g12389 [Leucocoprinus birnbaumii]
MAPTGEADHIISQITAIDNEIRELNNKRAALVQRLNIIQSPIVSLFPSEILSRVFWFATRPYDQEDQQRKPTLSDTRNLFAIGSVCSKWYGLTRSSPQLWATIGLHKKSTPAQTKSTDYVALLQYYYRHVGPSGLSISISDLEPTVEAVIDEIVRVALEDNPGKLRAFHTDQGWNCATGKSLWPSLAKYGAKDVEFSQLERLELAWNRVIGGSETQHEDASLFLRSPRLRLLSIDACRAPKTPLQFPWIQLTELSLKDSGAFYALQLLALCPNLVTFNFQHLPVHDWSSLKLELTTMQSLRSLTWEALGNLEARFSDEQRPNIVPLDFLRYFRLPSLRYLNWRAPIPDSAGNSVTIHDFFAQMHQLEILKLHPSPKSKFGIEHQLHSFQYLTRLDLYFIAKEPREPESDESDADETGWGTGATDEDREEMEEWFYRLAIKPGENLFPNLQSLHFTMGDVEADGPLVVLYSRRNGPVGWTDPKQNPRNLTLPPYDPASPHWRNHSRLTEFSFQAYHDSTEMEWDFSPHHSALQDMISEARATEGVEDSIWTGFKLFF